MKIRSVLAIGSLFAVLGVAAIGCDSGPDNAAACKEVVDKINGLSCLKTAAGAQKLPSSYCDAYNESEVDVASYFDCVSSHYKCKGDTLDLTEFAKVGSCKVPTE